MANLVIAEHDHGSLRAATLNVISAATAIGGDVHVLVAGHNASAAAAATRGATLLPYAVAGARMWL